MGIVLLVLSPITQVFAVLIGIITLCGIVAGFNALIRYFANHKKVLMTEQYNLEYDKQYNFYFGNSRILNIITNNRSQTHIFTIVTYYTGKQDANLTVVNNSNGTKALAANLYRYIGSTNEVVESTPST